MSVHKVHNNRETPRSFIGLWRVPPRPLTHHGLRRSGTVPAVPNMVYDTSTLVGVGNIQSIYYQEVVNLLFQTHLQEKILFASIRFVTDNLKKI